jgi:hypothetical protein
MRSFRHRSIINGEPFRHGAVMYWRSGSFSSDIHNCFGFICSEQCLPTSHESGALFFLVTLCFIFFLFIVYFFSSILECFTDVLEDGR